MAAPTSYTLAYDFTAFQASNPTAPLPADKIEIEFNALQITTDGIIANLGLIQRDDGALANSSVTYDALNNTLKALLGSPIVPRGEWVTAATYAVLDLVEEDGSTYICAVDHTADVFATDYAAGKWILWAAGSGGSVTINNDNWSGADLTVLNGGTGVSTLTGIVKGNGAAAFSAAAEGTDYYAPSGTDVAVADGGTGASTAADARTNLGLVIGTHVQAYDADLAAIAGLTSASNKIPRFTGSGTADLLDFLDEDDMTSDSATAVPSQQSVKKYVDDNVGVSRMNLLATVNASNSASVSFNNTYITSTYNKYIITIEDLIPASDGEDLWLRTDTNNGVSFETAGYSYRVHTVDGATPDAYVSDSDSRISLISNNAGLGIGNATGEGCYITITMYRPTDANDITKFLWDGVYSNSDGDIILLSGAGSHDTVEANDAIQLLMSTGNITSGTFKLYGVDET